MRGFRDVLGADARLRDECEVLKRKLAHVFHDDREAYTEAKTHFIEGALRQTGIEPQCRLASE
jgi:GrpB-like predicted nucleotidyltransferase (UPF0157 family)